MRALLKTALDGFKEDIGHPVSLLRLIDAQPQIRVSLDAPMPCIDAQSIVPWHELGRHDPLDWPRRGRGTLMGWKRDRFGYGSFALHRPEFSEIGLCVTTEDFACDITDVHGFCASKSELRDFASTDCMVERNAREMIDEISHEKLAKNLAHTEIRIIHSPGSDYFGRYRWDGRLFLMNSGGSHHFAAAKYIAARLSQPVALVGRLYTYSLNAVAIASLRRDFEMFVISDDTPVSLGFHRAMGAFGVTWLWLPLPRHFANARAILLPRSERRAARVAAVLRAAGVADLGAHLSQLAATLR